jgi:hypothetical protein
MGFFKKERSSESDLRFCIRALELPYDALFGASELKLAITKLVGRPRGSKAQNEAIAIGTIYNPLNFGPFLPSILRFNFHTSIKGIGSGEVYKPERDSTTLFYRSEFTVDDYNHLIFNELSDVMRHAAISRLPYTCITLHKGEKSSSARNSKSYYNELSNTADIKDLMLRIDKGQARMPSIKFSSVTFDDEILLPGPSWMSRWPNECMGTPIFRDTQVAEWREWMKESS